MTPQYVLRKSLCRYPHCYRSHVPGEGWVNNGRLDPTFLNHCLTLADLSEETPLGILADRLADLGHHETSNELRSHIERIADYRRQWHRAAITAIENLQWSNEYAEPGYTDPAKGILFANWNVFPRGVDTLLERYGYSIEWSDEWTTCGQCNRAVRTQPDCMSWSPHYHYSDGEITCNECLTESGPEESDYTTTDYIHWYQDGKLVLTVEDSYADTPDEQEYGSALRAHMERERFFPSAWYVNERGDSTLLNVG